jgi:hypothetical protein
MALFIGVKISTCSAHRDDLVLSLIRNQIMKNLNEIKRGKISRVKNTARVNPARVSLIPGIGSSPAAR